MSLRDEFVSQGNWLFRWRSYLPFVLLIVTGMAYSQFAWPFHSESLHEAWEYACMAISFFGMFVRILTVGCAPAKTSGRNTSSQLAAQLNTTGIYSIVRHPLYVGNYLIGLGIVSVLWVWWLPVIYTLLFWLYYERIMFAEEAFLEKQFGETFRKWASVTPAFWPNFSLWRPADLPFSLRNAIGREYTSFFVVIIGHTGIEFFEYVTLYHRLGWKPFWIAFATGGTVVYIVLRELKRRTTVFDVPGR